jgi:hypothetical protein
MLAYHPAADGSRTQETVRAGSSIPPKKEVVKIPMSP